MTPYLLLQSIVSRLGLEFSAILCITGAILCVLWWRRKQPDSGWGRWVCWGPLIGAMMLTAFGGRQRWTVYSLLNQVGALSQEQVMLMLKSFGWGIVEQLSIGGVASLFLHRLRRYWAARYVQSALLEGSDEHADR